MKMPPSILGLLLLGSAAGLPSFAADSPSNESPAAITWLRDLGEATVLARKTGKPMLAIFR